MVVQAGCCAIGLHTLSETYRAYAVDPHKLISKHVAYAVGYVLFLCISLFCTKKRTLKVERSLALFSMCLELVRKSLTFAPVRVIL